MQSLGERPSPDTVRNLMECVDLDGSGEIDFHEFCGMYGKQVEKERDETRDELYEVFKVFDIDGNGFIDRYELHKIMGGLGTRSFRAPEPAMVDELINDADKDGDGRINYDEFVKVMLEKGGSWM